MLEADDESGTNIYLTYINVSQEYDFLRDEPRFQALLEKMHLANYSP